MGGSVEEPSASSHPESRAYRSDIVDVSMLTLDDLHTSDDGALASALHRIMSDLETTQDAVAGFNSSA
jgi:FXSXX-COOH protein